MIGNCINHGWSTDEYGQCCVLWHRAKPSHIETAEQKIDRWVMEIVIRKMIEEAWAMGIHIRPKP